MTDELIDRFGDPPESVNGLIEVALLRNLASQLGIYEIKQQNDVLLLYKTNIDMKQVGSLISSMRSRVMLNAGAKPYISVKILPGATPLDTLTEILNTIRE